MNEKIIDPKLNDKIMEEKIKHNENFNISIKINFTGQAAVGKSSIISRYIDDTFSPKYIKIPGMEYHNKTYSSSSDKTIKAQIWDCSFDSMKDIIKDYYTTSNAAVIVYDITDRSSFENIPNFMQEIKKYCGKKILVYLVGNKADCNRQVSKEEGEAMASKGGMKFFEVSAKDGSNIDNVFEIIANEVIQLMTN